MVADIALVASVLLYAAGMLMLCEAFLTISAAFGIFLRKKNLPSDRLFGSRIPKHRFMIILGSTGFLIFALLYIYRRSFFTDQPTGYFKAIGETLTFIGCLLILYGMRGIVKRIGKAKGGKND